jgi:hypothetical protein
MKIINTAETTNERVVIQTRSFNLVTLGKLFLSLMAFNIISTYLTSSALAQFAPPLLPAVGNGSVPKPEILGDKLPSRPAPTGTALSTPISGTPVSHLVNPGRTTVYIYSNCTRGADDLMAGKHLVLTLRPATLPSKVVNDISNILGVELNSGQKTIQANATAHQLELIQAVLYPSANDSTLGLATISENGTKQINKAPTAEQWSQLRKSGDDSLYINAGILPTARVCARYFVMVAIAFSTVFLIFASSSIIFGQAHGGPRVIATGGGLMLLLMGYSIYKVAVINLFNADTTLKQNVDTIRYFSNQGRVSLANK